MRMTLYAVTVTNYLLEDGRLETPAACVCVCKHSIAHFLHCLLPQPLIPHSFQLLYIAFCLQGFHSYWEESVEGKALVTHWVQLCVCVCVELPAVVYGKLSV